MFRRFRVEDESMLPNFRPGDYVLVRGFRKLNAGDVIVFEQEGKQFLKRVERIRGNSVFVAGDNRARSRDSRLFGAVPRKQIVGKVLVHAKQ